jgi:hypothetical protein
MLFTELLRRLAVAGIAPVGRTVTKFGTMVFLGKSSDFVYPYRADVHAVFLDTDNPDLHPEVVKAIARRFFNGSLPDDPSPPKPN